jgi:hypothetical protein
MARTISWQGVLVRIGLALLLVLLTYNPSGYSYYHWALAQIGAFDAVKGFAGAVLLAGWAMCVRTAFTSLGVFGIALTALVLGTLVWLLLDIGLLRKSQPTLQWAVLIIAGVILGIGLSWSLLRERATGEIEVD